MRDHQREERSNDPSEAAREDTDGGDDRRSSFLDTDVIRILEADLPARFGGGPTDYQLLEEDDAGGHPRVVLVVRPEVGPLDPGAVTAWFLERLGRGAAAERTAERRPRGRAPRAGDHRRRQGPSDAESRGAPGGGKWSGRADLNGRPPAPKAGALPGCATPRPAYLTTLYRPGRRRLQSRERGRRRLPRLSQILRVVFLVKRLPAALIRRELLPVLLHQRPELRREPCFNCRSGPSRTWPS